MDITNISALKEEISRGAKAFKAFERGIENLAVLEGLAQFEKETKARTEQFKVEEKALMQSLADLGQALESKKAEKDQMLNSAKVNAAQILDRAKEVEQEIIKAAHAEGAAIVAGVKTQKAELDSLNNAIAAATQSLEALQSEISLMQKQKDDVLAKLRSIIA